MNKVKAIFAGIVIFCLICITLINSSSNDDNKGVEDVEEVKEIQLKLGDIGIINRFEDKTRCELVTALTVDKEYQDELFTTMEASDNIGLATMMLEGKAFVVDNCTEAKVVDTAMFLRKVRIIEGTSAGQAGWLPMEWIRIKE